MDAYEDLQRLSLQGTFYAAKEQSTVDMDLGKDPTIRTKGQQGSSNSWPVIRHPLLVFTADGII